MVRAAIIDGNTRQLLTHMDYTGHQIRQVAAWNTTIGAVENPSVGEFIFDTEKNTLCFYNGSGWSCISAEALFDAITGNLTGARWDVDGNIVINANVPSGMGFVYIVNQGNAGGVSLEVDGNIVVNGTVDGVDVGALAQEAAMNVDLDMEAMQIAFNAISWAQFAIWESFDDESRRDLSEPGNAAVIEASTLTSGNDLPSFIAKWKSLYYTEITVVAEGTSTLVGNGHLDDDDADWFDEQYKGFVLIDSSLVEFDIETCFKTPRRLVVTGMPSAGAYKVSAGVPAYAVAFCTYQAADNGGYGDVKLEVTFDGGSHWLTVLDTAINTNLIGGIIEMDYPGDSYALRLTLINDYAGRSPVVYRTIVCTDPSVWQ